MAYRSDTSPAESPSPASSTNASPYTHPIPLDAMVPADDDSSNSTQGTPNHSTTSLPRTQIAGKGGCWTCRVRRKKCDEQREGDSCKTCKRLTIKCLGWGPKRPDWMRDKKAVDDYKASIKAQLSRAGLIRGQPRLNPLSAPSQRRSTTHPTPRRSNSNNIPRPSTTTVDRSSTFPPSRQSVEQPYAQAYNELLPGVPGASNLAFDHLSYDDFDAPPSFFPNPTVAPFPNALGIDPLPDTHFHVSCGNGLDFLGPGIEYTASPAQPMMQDLVIHYFNNVRQLQFLFAGDALNEVTYTAVCNETQGAVSLAVSALADHHLKQLRVAQGLEAPTQTPETSSTSYLRMEALARLEMNKNAQRGWSDNDALAALHLVSLSQLSGGASDWETPFNILCQWLLQTNIHLAENSWIAFLNLSSIAQLNVKATLWIDIFSSLSKAQAPKFLPLWQSLLNGDQTNFWMNGGELDMTHRLRMDLLTGCPDEAMLAIADISSLAHWKSLQQRNSCLSYPELIRRGVGIEERLRRSRSESLSSNEAAQSRLGSANVAEEHRLLVMSIFREATVLYLHTVLSNSTPAVPEISSSVENLIQLFSQLPPSDLDRGLIFPICLAACMTNDSTRRDFFRNRVRGLNESFGNLLQMRRLMESVWQKRDVCGKEADVRESIQEQGMKLLLI